LTLEVNFTHHWRKVRKCWQNEFSVTSFTKKLHPTLPLNKTRRDDQLIRYKLYTVLQKDQHKSLGRKASCKMLMKLTTWGRFHQHFICNFSKERSQKCKNDSQVTSVFLRFWNLCTWKLCVKHWWNWQPDLQNYWNTPPGQRYVTINQ